MHRVRERGEGTTRCSFSEGKRGKDDSMHGALSHASLLPNTRAYCTVGVYTRETGEGMTPAR